MWIVIFTGALVLVGILQIIAMLLQERRMQESVGLAGRSADAAAASAEAAMATVKEMKDTARKELRARVFVAVAKRSGAASPGPFVAELVIRNFGKIPADDCTCTVGLLLDTYPPVEDNLPVLNATGREPRVVLPPDGDIHISKALPVGTFASLQHTQVMQESHAVYLYGRIEYLDGFGTERFSKFLMKCSGADYGFGRFTFCERGNEAT